MKLLDSNRFCLQGTANQFLHIATVANGVREYMCFCDLKTQKVYIEEITGGHLEFIDDDSLAEGIAEFLRESGVLDINKIMLPDSQWLKRQNE